MKKTAKVLALAGALSVGALTGAHAQALTSATTIAAEAPVLVGIGSVVGVVQVSSSVATSLTFAIPNVRNMVGEPQCATYDSLNRGPKPLRYIRTNEVMAVNSTNMTSGTLAVDDNIRCTVVYRP